MNPHRLKSWLQENKIFFETVAALLLSLMAVFVSSASVCIATRQERIARAQASPHIRIVLEPSWDDSKGRFTDEYLRVFNDGFALSQFQLTILSLYEVSVASSPPHTLDVPVSFFPVCFLTGNSTGLLCSCGEKNNNDHAARLEREILGLSNPKTGRYFSLRLVHLVSTSYRDALGGMARRYFLARPIAGAVEISQDEAAALQRRHADAGLAREMAELTGPQLFDRLLKDQ